MNPTNQSMVTYFIIKGFSDVPEMEVLIFLLVLLIYLITLSGNLTILILVGLDSQLHTPMYFFLGNLSVMDIFSTTTTLHNVFVSFMTRDKTISFVGCIMEFYIFASLTGCELLILTTMSYDRYVAICNPLHYHLVINFRKCSLLAFACCLKNKDVKAALMRRLIRCQEIKRIVFSKRLSRSGNWLLIEHPVEVDPPIGFSSSLVRKSDTVHDDDRGMLCSREKARPDCQANAIAPSRPIPTLHGLHRISSYYEASLEEVTTSAKQCYANIVPVLIHIILEVYQHDTRILKRYTFHPAETYIRLPHP
ncbi:olfactory receptor 2W3-like [Bombina bombina]|uniref:olfactory receptor 2W3-like n=1 Tax=Bombina bombina TaxID=8345 RepID=UPI00235A4E46|nr:olfactory receptor 2W3-like [Bombina bombina]